MGNIDPQANENHGLMLKDWDIWHTYSIYFIEDFDYLSLEDIAELLVRSNLCAAVYHTDNKIWWKIDGEVRVTKVDIKKVDGGKWKCSFDAKKLNLSSRNYALEGATQAIKMRISELNLFTPQYLDVFSYIRCYLNACYMSIGERVIALYPQIKIYDNGVINLTFRILASKGHGNYPLNCFMKYYVNLNDIIADYIEVPPEWLKLYLKDCLEWTNKSILDRYKTLNSMNELEANINKKIKEINEIDFNFHVSRLGVKDGDEIFFGKCTFAGLKDMVMSSLYCVINPPNEGIKYIALGAGKEKYHFAKISISRPNIYLLDFIDQPETSDQMIEKCGSEIGRIMSKVPDSEINGRKFIGKNLRALDDYILTMNQALSLWVFSQKGLNANKDYADLNRGHLIYDKIEGYNSANMLCRGT